MCLKFQSLAKRSYSVAMNCGPLSVRHTIGEPYRANISFVRETIVDERVSCNVSTSKKSL